MITNIPLNIKNPYTKELNSHQKMQYAKSDTSDKALYKFLTSDLVSYKESNIYFNYKDIKIIFIIMRYYK